MMENNIIEIANYESGQLTQTSVQRLLHRQKRKGPLHEMQVLAQAQEKTRLLYYP